jgi:hypothetical protein
MMFRVTLLFASLLTTNAFVLPLPRSSTFVTSATPLYGKNKNKSVETKTAEPKVVEAKIVETKVAEAAKEVDTKEVATKELDIEDLVNKAADFSVNDNGVLASDLIDEDVEEDEKTLIDAEHMNLAIQVAQSP